jgi:tRNA(Ile2) C34 agmatinyltransferase TiaS
MSAVATREPRALDMERPQTQHLFEPEELTLEEVVLRAWESLRAEGRAGCPVCGGSMSAGSGCGDCGAELT